MRIHHDRSLSMEPYLTLTSPEADSADYAVRTKEEVSKVLLTYSPPELLERANQVRRERAQQAPFGSFFMLRRPHLGHSSA